MSYIISEPAVIESRLKICESCEKSVDMSSDPLYTFVDALGNLIPNATKTMCSECSCPIWVKVRVPANTCPLNKWPE